MNKNTEKTDDLLTFLTICYNYTVVYYQYKSKFHKIVRIFYNKIVAEIPAENTVYGLTKITCLYGGQEMFMLVCTSCGKTYQRGKYCSLCGSVLKERILNYETTNTLLRSNVRLDSVRPVSQDDASNVYGTLPRIKKEQASYMNKTANTEMYNPELSESFRHSFDEALKKRSRCAGRCRARTGRRGTCRHCCRREREGA